MCVLCSYHLPLGRLWQLVITLDWILNDFRPSDRVVLIDWMIDHSLGRILWGGSWLRINNCVFLKLSYMFGTIPKWNGVWRTYIQSVSFAQNWTFNIIFSLFTMWKHIIWKRKGINKCKAQLWKTHTHTKWTFMSWNCKSSSSNTSQKNVLDKMLQSSYCPLNSRVILLIKSELELSFGIKKVSLTWWYWKNGRVCLFLEFSFFPALIFIYSDIWYFHRSKERKALFFNETLWLATPACVWIRPSL